MKLPDDYTDEDFINAARSVHQGYGEMRDAWELAPVCEYADAVFRCAYREMLAAAPVAKPSVPDGWKEAAIAWEVCGSLHREYAKGKDPFFKKRQEDFVKHANDARAMIAAAPEAKP